MTLTNQDFERLSRFIHQEVGIKMPPTKKIMLEGRLRKRIRELGLEDYAAYCRYFFDEGHASDEIVHLIDQVTTNKTDFFREPEHFSFLTRQALPELLPQVGTAPLKLWSAGCSTGQEPYTLSMVLSQAADISPQRFSFQILATDISSQVLGIARRAIYPEDAIAPVAMEYRKKYLLRSRDSSKKLVRIAPKVRKAVRFDRLNFMDRDFGLREKMDIIFCRNVLIYFNRETQAQVVGRFCQHLRPGGFLFLGHSESLHGMTLPLVQVGPTIYRRAD